MGQNNQINTTPVKQNNPFTNELLNAEAITKKNILIGDIFSKGNICIKRPGNGLQPKFWKKILGKKSKYRFKKDKAIRL